MLRITLALALFSTTGLAQISRSVTHPNIFTYYKTTALSGAAEKITIQQPASSAKRVLLKSVTVCGTVDTTWTISQNGTAASSTAATEFALTDGTNVANVFHTSNAGTGTTIMAYPLTGTHCRTIDLSDIHLIGAGTTENFSVGTNSITGTVYINLKWEERNR